MTRARRQRYAAAQLLTVGQHSALAAHTTPFLLKAIETHEVERFPCLCGLWVILNNITIFY